jgi:teichoic acid transport system permease protein
MATATHPHSTSLVYEPSAAAVPPLIPYLREVWAHRDLVWHLARTDMKAEHYDTAMGKFWLVLDPMLTAATFYLVRIVLVPDRSGPEARLWIAHLIMGVTFFFYVRKLFEGAARAVISNKVLVLNTAAPRGVYPAVVLVRAVSDFIPGLIVYFAVHLITGQPWGLSLLTLPLVTLLLTGFAFGLGLLFAPLIVFVSDIGTLVPYAIRIWLYVSPVMYLVSEIPEGLQTLFLFNPLYPFFASLEEIFLGEWPSTSFLVAQVALCVVSLVVGSAAFLRKEREFALRL